MFARCRRAAEFHGLAFKTSADLAVLRCAPLCNIHLGHIFVAGCEFDACRTRHGYIALHDSIAAYANFVIILPGLYVNI